MKAFRLMALALCASLFTTACWEDIFGPDDPYTPTEKTYSISVSPNGTVTFPAEGGKVDFTVSTNADYTGCSFPKRDWLTMSHENKSQIYTATVSANDTGSDREFQLTFYATVKGSDEKVATKVVNAVQPFVQSKELWVKVTPSTLEFPAEGGSLNTVVSWSNGINRLRHSRRQSVSEWATAEWQNSDGKKLLVITASANDTGKERSGIIDVYGGIETSDMDNAQNGNLDPERAAATQLHVTQPAGSGQGGDTPAGALSGGFSVDGSGHSVCFSQGNLQYQASTNTWRFAEKQWNYIGNDNSKIGKSYSGWIDLFGWGTSGYNCGNYFYNPYDSTLDANHINENQYGPKGYTSLTDSNAKSDWGVYNAISNGGKQAGLWRTMTHNEFDYLVFKRSTASGARFAKAVVNNVNGLILFPDNWSKGTYSVNSINEESANFSVNKISSSNWTKLEDAGCVFLPAAGWRTNDYDYTLNHMQGVGTSGEYWTSSGQATETDADHLCFYNEGLLFRSWPRCEGRSVRLVRDM